MVGELAIYFALMMGLKVAYTTPLKALSNQKYQDFKNRYGADRVGLLTGDIAINRGAAITIMTTEVFRNMIYDSDSSNQLNNLFMVCFDEFHFMNDPDRGTVWEESVISCPPSVRILALSATMGNVEEIRGWISSIHGPTDLILSNHRPVPLRYLFALKQGLMPLFRDPNAGPGLSLAYEAREIKHNLHLYYSDLMLVISLRLSQWSDQSSRETNRGVSIESIDHKNRRSIECTTSAKNIS